jgi:hypothetical protein
MAAPRSDGRPHGRPQVPRRLVLGLAWTLATLVGLLVAAETKIGPVLLTLSPTHGVHLGDVLAFAGCYGIVLFAQLGWPRGRSTTRDRPGPHDPSG